MERDKRPRRYKGLIFKLLITILLSMVHLYGEKV